MEAKCVLLKGVNLDFPPQTQKFARRYEGERALKSFEILGSAS